MKKIVSILICLVLISSLVVAFAACDDKAAPAQDKKTIVYLGDSIAEALIGPTPLSERDNYGYYAIVGKINNFKYYNHSVSGHKTSDGMLNSGTGLLEMVSKEDEDGNLMRTHIQEADILHISILGNNALQYDMGYLLEDIAKPDFKERYAAGDSLVYYMVNGSEGVAKEKITFTHRATGVEEVYNFPKTYQNICDIVAKLKELNPNAKIIFQKVYNPVFEGTTLLANEYWDELAKITDDGRFGAEGTKITTWAQRRAVAQELLSYLNGVLDTYQANHPGDIYTLDVTDYFAKLAGNDLSKDSVGAKLLFLDWTHPSNKGHAAIAAKTQLWLEEIGMADANALQNYKDLRIEQINRMYKGLEGFDADKAIAGINAASTIQAVSDAYFAATDAYKLPNYLN